MNAKHLADFPGP